ncbi:MAG: ARMT1-like domain-containing protein [Candidatus Gygaella obscura]|nr:ARMT1-like domain-containing protein [Candidatus Gygaella obscura]
MQTYLECIPCFFKQAIESSRMIGASLREREQIVRKVAALLARSSFKKSPPEIASSIHAIIKSVTKNPDPYKEIKYYSNRQALRIYPYLKKIIKRKNNRLLIAVELAIAGNIIDYGVKNSLNVEQELQKILAQEEQNLKKKKKFFDFIHFKKDLQKAKTILYLADNAGETVFDRVLLEEIKVLYPKKHILYAVKEKPIINDALKEDAFLCKIDKSAEIITSGMEAPGTIIKKCSKQFLRIFKTADMVISKGQGNFESLSGNKRKIYFLFMAKCPVVANSIGSSVGDINLVYNYLRKL